LPTRAPAGIGALCEAPGKSMERPEEVMRVSCEVEGQ
jgi:hypothetical protein